MQYKLLIVDDEPAITASLQFALEDEFQVLTAGNAADARAIAAAGDVDIILLDLKLGADDGIEVLKQIKAVSERSVVIIMTAYGSIRSSVGAMKAGAFYYITKPIDREELGMLLANAGEYLRLQSQVRYLHGKLSQGQEASGLIGQSAAMREVSRQIEKVRDIESNVLITGESGTGKELVAKAIHYSGRRRNEPFEVVNCAAIPGELLESELFGHEKGAFTGAFQRKKGLFALADKGTLFLDEIGEMDLRLQAKLLRVVQEKEICPLGSAVRQKVNVRIVCATNRDLQREVKAGRFREDLFFRLNVIRIPLPPLRERREDIPELIAHFVAKYNREMGRSISGPDSETLAALLDYDWRGNVRELENLIERAIVFAEGQELTLTDLPAEITRQKGRAVIPDSRLVPVYIGEAWKQVEEKLIRATLKACADDKVRAAQLLKISERKLWYKLKEYETQTDG